MLSFDSKQTAKKSKRKFLGTSSNLNHEKTIHKKGSYSKYYLKILMVVLFSKKKINIEDISYKISSVYVFAAVRFLEGYLLSLLDS